MADSLITDSEVAILNAAQTILKDLAERAMKASYDAIGGYDTARPVDYGRFGEAADMAQHAIFNALNVGRSYHVLTLTDQQLHNRSES